MAILNFADATVTLLLVPVDMRFGFDRLAAIARDILRINLNINNQYIVFFSKNRTICKIIHIDEKGTVLIVRKLHEGKFEQLLSKQNDPDFVNLTLPELEKFFNGENIYTKRIGYYH